MPVRHLIPTVLSAVLIGTLAPQSASAASTTAEVLAAGVTVATVIADTPRGPAVGYLTTVDLRRPSVHLGLLHAGSVSRRVPVSRLLTDQRALAGVNGDFFNISETHAGVAPTDSADGPEIADGIALKANVPDGQRFGPALPPGTGTRDVFGVGFDGRARLGSLALAGHLITRHGVSILAGFNQYALAVGGIGLYTSAWGDASRLRATCGTDTDRAAACSTDTAEVVVRRGVVVSTGATPGSGAIAADSQVLVGREAGADTLRALVPGERVWTDHRLTGAAVPFAFALGGFPILRAGAPLAGLNDTTAAVRTAAGTSADGRTVYLLALDGRGAVSAGLTISEEAAWLRSLGATDAVNLDGGGSTELATRDPATGTVTVRNSPSGGAERPVPNGIGVFAHPTGV
jgi:hypothetical protein